MPHSVRRHIPNLLTMARGLMAVMFFVSISLYRYPNDGEAWLVVATVLFVIAAATDFLDGHLARRWEVVTGFGRVMDPFCDKLLVLGAMICLAGPRFLVPEWTGGSHLVATASALTPWMVVIVIARELFVTSIRGMAEASGTAFGAKWSGKAKMVVQSVAIPVTMTLIIVAPPSTHAWSAWAIRGLMWAAVAVTVASGLPYLAAIPRLLRGADQA
ncbi:MAG: CDP-alcohol phosphatidyltransferase family protein [Phycisphaerales bacterium]|jgi:CDP-diacylglycerol--glycerol-3-phosphate 3-phosphatidyltransferase|nr:CDP-alcohol phosphatidyltransferase family protein [Phycisphaerales bacterium]